MNLYKIQEQGQISLNTLTKNNARLEELLVGLNRYHNNDMDPARSSESDKRESEGLLLELDNLANNIEVGINYNETLITLLIQTLYSFDGSSLGKVGKVAQEEYNYPPASKSLTFAARR